MEEDAPGLTWQVGIWDRLAAVYQHEIDGRFAPVVAGVVRRGAPQPGQNVLDLGTGTGTVARAVAPLVAPQYRNRTPFPIGTLPAAGRR